METIHHSFITRPLPPTHLSSISTVLIIELESVSLPWLKAMAIPKSFIPFEDKNSARETGKKKDGYFRPSIFQFPNEFWLFWFCSSSRIKAFCFKSCLFQSISQHLRKKKQSVRIKSTAHLKKENVVWLSSAEHKRRSFEGFLFFFHEITINECLSF